MATKDIKEKLQKLQDILVKKYELEAKIEEAPKSLGNNEELLSRLKKEYIAINTDYEALKAKIGDLKVELDKEIKVREDGEKAMDNISTHREYEALDKQINEAKAKEEDLRKNLQQEEKALQALDENLKFKEEIIKSSENQINEAKNKMDAEIASYKKELASLQKKEDDITPSLDQEIIFKFQRIIQRNSDGIVAVKKNGVCTGCQMILPAQFANTVREATNILFCPYCSRVLFYEDSDEGDTESFYNIGEVGSLVDLNDGFDDEIDDDDDREESIDQTENRLNGNEDDNDSESGDSEYSSDDSED